MTGLGLTTIAPRPNADAPHATLVSAAISDSSIDQADLLNNELAEIGPGGTLILAAGSYAIGSPLKLLTGQTLRGEGATIVPATTLNSLLETTGTATIVGVQLQNVNGWAKTALHATDGSGSSVDVINDAIIGFGTAIQIDSGAFDIENSFFLGNGLAVGSAQNAGSGTIRGNYVLGGSGVDLADAGSDIIVSNIILPAILGAYGVKIEAGSSTSIQNNVVDQIISGPGIIVDGTQTPITSVSIRNNYVGANLYARAATNGIQISGSVSGTTIAFNTLAGWSQYDLAVSQATDLYVTGNNLSSVSGAGNVSLSSVAAATLVGNVLESGDASIIETGSTYSTDIGNTLASAPSYSKTSTHAGNRGGGQVEAAPTAAKLSTVLSQSSSALTTTPSTRSSLVAGLLVPGWGSAGTVSAVLGQGDNAVAINAALARLPPGGTLALPSGTYSIKSTIELNGRNLIGTGTVMIPTAPMSSMVALTNGFSMVSGLTLLNQSGFADAAITVVKPVDNLPTSITDTIIQGFSCGIMLRGDNFSVGDNSLVNNQVGVYLGTDTLNGRVTGNQIVGGSGIDLEGGEQQPEGVDISSNVIDPHSPGAYGVLIRSGLAIQVTGNTISGIVSSAGVMLDASTADVADVSVVGNFVSGDADQNGSNGVVVSGNVTNTVVAQNTIVGLTGFDVSASGGNKLNLSSNTFDSTSSLGNIRLQNVANATVIANTLGSSAIPILETGYTAANDFGNFRSTLHVEENSSAVSLGIPSPNESDPTITVTGLPSDGFITRASGGPLLIGAVLSSDDLAGLSFTPTFGAFDQSSSFDYRVVDAAGHSYSADMKLLIGVAAGNPVVASHDVVAGQTTPIALGIAAPTDPNYSSDSLVITVASLPSNGQVALANGNTVSVGTVLTSNELAGLYFTSASGASGQNSTFGYTVSDPAGNSATGVADISVAPSTNSNLLAGTVLPVIDPNLKGSFAVTDAEANVSGGSDGTSYAGPLNYLQSQFIWTGTDGIALRADVPNVFLHGGSGNDALQATSGRNVLDGGSGSNFLVGATGTDGSSDVFFLDERSGATTWSTLVNFHVGDEATIWGYQEGTSALSWSAWTGTDGFQGAAMYFDIAGSGTGASAALTFAGVTEQVAGSAFAIDSGSVGGNSYLHIYYSNAH